MADFKKYLPILKQVEGGFQALPGDNGNYNSLGQLVGTNHGISARFYESIIKRPPTVADIKNLSLQYAQYLYKLHFWDKVHGDLIENQTIANIVCDHAINAGESTIAKIVQSILVHDFKKQISIDGNIGVNTVKAMNSVDQNQLFAKIKEGRKNFYINIGGQFLSGWLQRLKSFIYIEEKKK